MILELIVQIYLKAPKTLVNIFTFRIWLQNSLPLFPDSPIPTSYISAKLS